MIHDSGGEYLEEKEHMSHMKDRHGDGAVDGTADVGVE
jgi:hypothetical protein